MVAGEYDDELGFMNAARTVAIEPEPPAVSLEQELGVGAGSTRIVCDDQTGRFRRCEAEGLAVDDEPVFAAGEIGDPVGIGNRFPRS